MTKSLSITFLQSKICLEKFDGSCYNGGNLRNALPPQVGKSAHATPVATLREAARSASTSRETRPTHWLNFSQNPKWY
ncbi:hypothetical protein I8752_26050 [Nostocaceae cyanobacterium CENA369]|uniref:Uncharacterized protein n=1 Tax=Dendronalium phyllosphericum CENA369 TaxID=1725256 RepID=A0A8J7LHP8_9NOST|nr:hypothetical protein [Dendronalium phyllosphericum]MBH8576388.1 hypothetical protein [Dendronalium phyllosphericum CENA369]